MSHIQNNYYMLHLDFWKKNDNINESLPKIYIYIQPYSDKIYLQGNTSGIRDYEKVTAAKIITTNTLSASSTFCQHSGQAYSFRIVLLKNMGQHSKIPLALSVSWLLYVLESESPIVMLYQNSLHFRFAHYHYMQNSSYGGEKYQNAEDI